jgi:hypothetical protein
MTRYTHEYIDYIRSYMTATVAKTRSDRELIPISMLLLDYFLEIVRISGDYKYDDLWNCPEITTNEPFAVFYDQQKNEKRNELEQTVVSYILQNLT